MQHCQWRLMACVLGRRIHPGPRGQRNLWSHVSRKSNRKNQWSINFNNNWRLANLIESLKSSKSMTLLKNFRRFRLKKMFKSHLNYYNKNHNLSITLKMRRSRCKRLGSQLRMAPKTNILMWSHLLMLLSRESRSRRFCLKMTRDRRLKLMMLKIRIAYARNLMASLMFRLLEA